MEYKAALFSKDNALKRNALRALGTDKQSVDLLFDSTTLTARDLHVRRVAFAKLASLSNEATRTKTANLLLKQKENQDDEWLSLALKAAGGSLDNDRVADLARNGVGVGQVI